MIKTFKVNNYIELAGKLAFEFINLIKGQKLPANKYEIELSQFSNCQDVRSARKVAFNSIQNGFKKIAFDTRRINQETQRNPRANLQYWHRSQPFIEEEDQKRLEAFAKLLGPVNQIKKSFGTQPEYFNSYARTLADLVHRVTQVNKSEVDIFRPQLDYLEQLLFARYRLSLEDLTVLGEEDLAARVLSKDEDLIRRGNYLYSTGWDSVSQPQIVKTNQEMTQEAIIQGIFGNTEFRKAGEKSATRTITIIIKDEVD